MSPRLAKAIVNGLLFGLAVLSVAPLLWMLSVSFMQPGEASSFPPPLLPSTPTWHNYHELFAKAGMGRYLFNSFLIASITTLIALLLNTMAGYGFAKLRFAGRERVFRALLAALVIPAQVTMMPLFLMLKQIGLVNSYAAAIVPGMAGIFGIFLVRQYARSIPDELLEAARIDGAGDLLILLKIVIPLSLPALLTLVVVNALYVWNDLLIAIIFLQDDSKRTLMAGISVFQGRYNDQIPLTMAGMVFASAPMIILYLVFQKHYIQGMMAGSVK